MIDYICDRIVRGNCRMTRGNQNSPSDSFGSGLFNKLEMKEIKLTQGKITLVDDEDYIYLNQWKWCVQKNRHTYYVIRSQRFPIRKTIRMHRLILKVKKGEMIDHKDRNGLNNQKNNLRYCTNSENQRNKINIGKSKYRGVSIRNDRGHKRITARITIKGKNHFIGNYKTEEEAALAFNRAAKIYYGDFALFNHIPDPETNLKLQL